MNIGIIGAMEPEVAIFKKKLTQMTSHEHAGFTFYQGQLNGTNVVIVQSGIGKVAAALATAMLIDKFSPDFVVNTGSAGGFAQNLKVGDIVIGAELCYHDVDVTAFDYEIGQLPANPPKFIADQRLIAAAKLGVEQLSSTLDANIQTMIGLIATGDTFMTAEDDIAKARKNFPEMIAVEMEGAAIAQTCHQFNIPFVVIRSMSDIAGKESPQSFEEYLETAAVNSSQLVENMLNNLKD